MTLLVGRVLAHRRAALRRDEGKSGIAVATVWAYSMLPFKAGKVENRPASFGYIHGTAAADTARTCFDGHLVELKPVPLIAAMT